jgi:OPA family glycerol-3-phosphate transporter-like MFS transporter
LLFAFSAVSALAIVLLLDHVTPLTFVIIVILMAWITGCMHAANHIFITRIPGAFKQVGRVSGIVGTLNAITYVGGALSPYAVAVVAGNGGWDRAVMLWVILAVLSAVLCLTAYRKWNLFRAGVTR